MAQAALKLTARVLPGKRIEFTAPELTEGEDVEIFVALPTTLPLQPTSAGETTGVWDWLQSLPPSTLTREDWARIEQEMQEEKDAWDR